MAKRFEKVMELPRSDEDKSDRQFVSALARGLEVLRAFQPEDGPLGNQELALRTGLPKSTVSRITHTLTTLGYLDYIARQSSYVIAPSVLALGHACVSSAAIRRAALPHMRELAELTEASVALGVRDRLSMIYLDVARGSRTVAFSLDAGARVPLHRTAMGAAFLSALPDKERAFLLDAVAKAEGDAWPETSRRLSAAFTEIEAHGFCSFEGIYERAMNAVGAALRQPDGMVYAFSCSAPVFQFPPARLREEIGPRLVVMRDTVLGDLRMGSSTPLRNGGVAMF
jgi:DNA-binding IclR family transcriptional regulator